MADKTVAITCEGFKIRRQDGNGFKQGELKDVPGLQEVSLEPDSGSEPIYADGVKKLNLYSGVTGATVTASLMQLSSEEREMFLGIKVEDGMELYTTDLVPPNVSVSWKYRCSDGSYIYFGLPKGNFNLPESKASTMEDKPEQQDQSEIEGSFVGRDSDKLVYTRVWSGTEGFDEAKFYEKIHGAPTAPTETVQPGETTPTA